ncbi:short-chain dehydrogenase reductase 3a-like [Rhododendron vialii]|uniref:short-chain dehydrogenase reductase 3a-like n=1 Tax=Rhododendron vialii TaxID=182163 RepID=UPI00265E738A|nr:short-chain dehydrogenase reductase 3a-like [Rhododendron vialii]
MSKQRRLEGKVAIITGAASGIGEAAAKLFVENGAFVVVADIQEELGLKVVASIAGPDVNRAIYKNCDVTVEKQVEETVAFAIEKYGTLDIMYSNAGILGPMDSILDMDMEEGFDRTMAVNLRGPALCIKHAARAMVKRQVRGSIICTASTASVLGGMGPISYSSSKHGQHSVRSDESSIYVSGHNLAVDGGFTVVDNSIAMIASQMLMKQKQ